MHEICQIVHLAPYLKILVIANKYREGLFLDLNNLIKDEDGEVDLYIEGDSSSLEGLSNFKRISDFKTLLRKVREYEYTILVDSIDLEDEKNIILNYAYHSLENSGQLICLLSREGNRDSLKIEEMITKVNFLAVNRTDLSAQEYILTAKKMHGWDGGL